MLNFKSSNFKLIKPRLCILILVGLIVVERNDSQPPLDWTIRKNITLGSARGIAYLHYSCDPKIIHRDLKAAKILFFLIANIINASKTLNKRRMETKTKTRKQYKAKLQTNRTAQSAATKPYCQPPKTDNSSTAAVPDHTTGAAACQKLPLPQNSTKTDCYLIKHSRGFQHHS